MATDGFVPLNERQADLCREIGLEPDGLCVIRESEDYLWMRHQKTWNEVTVRKSETQKRKEKELKLW